MSSEEDNFVDISVGVVIQSIDFTPQGRPSCVFRIIRELAAKMFQYWLLNYYTRVRGVALWNNRLTS